MDMVSTKTAPPLPPRHHMPSTHRDIDPIQQANHSSWDHVIDQLASSNNGIHHTLNVSSALREQLGNTLIRLLHIRVENLMAAGRLSEALDETSIMRQLRPASPLGYLLEGDISSNMQGKQAAALSIIDHGIDIASKMDPSYPKLLDSKNRIRQKQQLRIDFIKELPTYIVSKRIAPLLLTSSMKHDILNVSSIWQQRLAPVLGMHVEIRDAQDWTTGHRRIIHSAPWIKSLSLKHCQQSPYTLFQRREFQSLEKLRIEDCPIYKLLNISNVGKRLTHLLITDGYGTQSMRLQSLLLTFPNLEIIQCFGVCDLDTSTLHVGQRYPKVHTLHFWTNSMSKKGVKSIVSCFPSLQRFAIFHRRNPVQCLVEMAPMDDDGELVYFGSSFDTCHMMKGKQPAVEHMLYLDGEGVDIDMTTESLLQANDPQVASVIFNSNARAGMGNNDTEDMARYLTMATRYAPRLNSFLLCDLNLHEGQWMQFLQSFKPRGMQPFYLEMIECPGVTDRVLENIIPRKSIRSIRFDGLANITQKGVSRLLRSKSFDDITIVNCPNAVVPRSDYHYSY